ncbi:kinase-like domain-containing protein [Truncatella angustata]|uniref:Kinase-like domain-containing protein n=1 Tax=Truncatella angustata TaxID=152316 RepID=A0A9P8UP74_9PEZI|nr:kinase-like domain-containing protein [Truncatella angustata]KAH6655586.1 kinase-like domain-containing protein [Truncatella angustata]
MFNEAPAQSAHVNTDSHRLRYKPVVSNGKATNIEDVEEYQPGGFYPVDIGDKILKIFEIVHKIGHGQYATVWLGWNLIKHEWRAIKIFKARCSAKAMSAFKKLEKANLRPATDHTRAHIQLPEEASWIKSANGQHLSFVLPLHGPPITYHDRKSRTVHRKLLLQAAEGLRFLHDNGIAHGGIRPSNVLIRLKNIGDISKEIMVEKLGRPVKHKVEAVEPGAKSVKSHAPNYLVASTTYLERLEKELEVVIVDTGIASSIDEKRNLEDNVKDDEEVRYMAPEVYFRFGTSHGSDVWSFALLVARMRRRHCDLFAKRPGSEQSRRESYEKELLDAYDASPGLSRDTAISAKSAQATTDFIERIRTRLDPKTDSPNSSEDRLPRAEVEALVDLLAKMLGYTPEHRITMQEVVGHVFFDVVGKPFKSLSDDDLDRNGACTKVDSEPKAAVEVETPTITANLEALQLVLRGGGPHETPEDDNTALDGGSQQAFEAPPTEQIASASESSQQRPKAAEAVPDGASSQERSPRSAPGPSSPTPVPGSPPAPQPPSARLAGVVLPSTGGLTLLGFVLASVLFLSHLLVYMAANRTSARGTLIRKPCGPGFVSAQTRRLSAQTVFFEGVMAFPEHKGAMNDVTECPVFDDLRFESEVKAIT